VFDWRSDMYLFVTPRGRLAMLQDRRVRLGPPVGGLGELSAMNGRLVVFIGKRRFTIMREDGSVVGSAGWDPRRETLVVGPAASPDGRSFIYELVRARAGGRWGAATLYVLHRGSRRGRVLLRRWRSPVECVEGGPCTGGLDWNGRFFLYEPGDGHIGAVDSATGRLIDLTRFDRSLPHLGHRRERATVAWRSDFPR